MRSRSGPAPTRLVIGGRFAIAGWLAGSSTTPVAANNIATFDGTSWSALGAGLEGNPQYGLVRSLATLNNTLYAGGLYHLYTYKLKP